MSITIKKSTEFHVNELIIVTKIGRVDISKLFVELNIFDSMFLPVMSGNMLIQDSIGISGKLLFDGTESLLIDIGKDKDSDIARFKKAFRIYKQSDRVNQNQNSETFVLHFVADELMFSDQQRVNQSYDLTYSQIVEKILFNYLKIPANNIGGLYEPTMGIRKIVIPNLRPLDAIEWCAKRSLDKQNSPNYVFFQNLVGYNFASLSTLLTQDNVLDIKIQSKNLKDSNAFDEIGSARHYDVVAQNDSIEKTRAGVNAGKFMGFDPMTRSFASKNISFGDHYLNMKHGNKNPNVTPSKNRDHQNNLEAYDSKKVVSLFGTARQYSEYIKKMIQLLFQKLKVKIVLYFKEKQSYKI